MKKIALLSLLVLLSLPAIAAQTKQATNSLDAYAPFEELLQITPSDATTYSPPMRGCIVEADGDLVLTPIKNASTVTITVVAGQIIPVVVSKINAATTATVVCGR